MVTFREKPAILVPMLNERKMTILTAADSEATISHYGAQLLRFTPYTGVPAIDFSPLSDPATAQNVRGGIPICLPWFGRAHASSLELPDNAPAHGFARNISWDLVEVDDYYACFRMTHQGDPNAPEGSPAKFFPHSFEAEMKYVLSTDLVATLTVTNTDNHDWAFEAALHTYLCIGDLKDIQVFGLENAEFFDALKGSHRRQTCEELTFVGPVDRVYRSDNNLIINDPRYHRRLLIETENMRSVIVWTPWKDGVESIADIPDDLWDSFVCIEVGNVWDDAVSLAPGQSLSMSMRLSGESMLS